MNEDAEQARRRELARSYRESGEVLVRTSRPRLTRIARKLGLDISAAKDVVQLTFMQLFHRRPKVQDVEAWLAVVVRRRSLDWRRREAVHAQGVCPTTIPNEPVAELSPEQRLAVRAVLGKLSKRLRTLVEARYLDGHTEAEAAELAGYAPNSYKKSMTRALQLMRVELERGCRERAPNSAHRA